LKIAIGSDHRGFPLKEHLVAVLARGGHEVIDLGCTGTDSVDYPDYAFPVAEKVAKGEVERGILICGSGIGMSIAANKVKGVRASLCRTVDDARMTRQDNDSNVLTLSIDSLQDNDIDRLVGVWLDTPFEGGRHQRRLDKIERYEDRRGR
jgi:ribose 5-phosphate isomerase B